MGVARSAGPQRPDPARRPNRPAGGRAERGGREVLDLIALVAAAEPAERPADPADLGPEERRILGSCRGPVTVAEVASVTALPLDVVRALLAGLVERGQITVLPRSAAGEYPGTGLLNEVLQGLRTL
jgi:hypothetical protein